MTYLTIRGEGALPVRRVDFARFAGLFAEAEAPPPVRPSRGLAGITALARLAAAPLLVAALAGDLVLPAKSSVFDKSPGLGKTAPSVATPS